MGPLTAIENTKTREKPINQTLLDLLNVTNAHKTYKQKDIGNIRTYQDDSGTGIFAVDC